jgi:hypothetical protein
VYKNSLLCALFCGLPNGKADSVPAFQMLGLHILDHPTVGPLPYQSYACISIYSPFVPYAAAILLRRPKSQPIPPRSRICQNAMPNMHAAQPTRGIVTIRPVFCFLSVYGYFCEERYIRSWSKPCLTRALGPGRTPSSSKPKILSCRFSRLHRSFRLRI